MEHEMKQVQDNNMESKKRILTSREHKEVWNKIYALVDQGKTKTEVFEILSEEYYSLYNLAKKISQFPTAKGFPQFKLFSKIIFVISALCTTIISSLYIYALISECLAGYFPIEQAWQLLIIIPVLLGIICFLFWVTIQIKRMNGRIYIGISFVSLIVFTRNILALLYHHYLDNGTQLLIYNGILLAILLTCIYILFKYYPHIIRPSKRLKYKQYYLGEG